MKPELIKVETIAVTVTAGGVASGASKHINGEILKLVYDKGTINAASTLATKETETLETIDSYDINAGSAVRYPRAAITGASAGDNKWTPFPVHGTITVSGTGCAASKACSIKVYWR